MSERLGPGDHYTVRMPMKGTKAHLDPKAIVCQTHKVGWSSLPRETKLEWPGPTLRCRDRWISAYATVCGEGDLLGRVVNDTIDCLGTAVVAAGLAAIIANPAAAGATFEAAFKACMASKIGDVANSFTVALSTQTETGDWGRC